VAQYADAMIQLIEGKLQYDPRKSRKMIEEKFSTKQHIAQLLNFYEEELKFSIFLNPALQAGVEAVYASKLRV
jgi:glycosyltransferase involved in cell wall biosynthesis